MSIDGKGYAVVAFFKFDPDDLGKWKGVLAESKSKGLPVILYDWKPQMFPILALETARATAVANEEPPASPLGNMGWEKGADPGTTKPRDWGPWTHMGIRVFSTRSEGDAWLEASPEANFMREHAAVMIRVVVTDYA